MRKGLSFRPSTDGAAEGRNLPGLSSGRAWGRRGDSCLRRNDKGGPPLVIPAGAQRNAGISLVFHPGVRGVDEGIPACAGMTRGWE